MKLSTAEWFPGRICAVSLFQACYARSGSKKELLRSKFIELCNEDTPMIRRACANKLGAFSSVLEK
jgi:serine/threonine-protein phosphatase 2A regulatory subunit A